MYSFIIVINIIIILTYYNFNIFNDFPSFIMKIK